MKVLFSITGKLAEQHVLVHSTLSNPSQIGEFDTNHNFCELRTPCVLPFASLTNT